jgi:uncharacterized membrane protein
MQTPEPTSKTLNAIRSPLVFNAFLTISLAGVVGAVLYSDLPKEVKIYSLAFFGLWFAGVVIWTAYIARKDPRSLAYGPNEYLKESQMKYEHERAMAKLLKG